VQKLEIVPIAGHQDPTFTRGKAKLLGIACVTSPLSSGSCSPVSPETQERRAELRNVMIEIEGRHRQLGGILPDLRVD
jgi:hypothetical protein